MQDNGDALVTIEESWAQYAKDIVEAIEQGMLDDSIRHIARTCFDRRDALNDGQFTPVRTVEPKMYEPMKDDNGYLRCPVNPRKCGWFSTALTLAAHLNDQHSPVGGKGTPDAPAPRTRPRKAPRGRVVSDVTFRYLDGRLYHRREVIGQVLRMDADGVPVVVKVKGVGPKAAKVVFCSRSGIELSSKGNANRVPPKYREGSDIKDPIFMGLKVIQPIIDRCTPVQE